MLAVLFLCSFLDRTNVGNARLYNLEPDLRMTDRQYDIGLAVFYATYILRSVVVDMMPFVQLTMAPVAKCRATWS